MSNERLIMALAKVLIATAWADGDLTNEEVNSMKDLLWRLPQLSARQWASLQIYIEAPVGEAERARLVEDMRKAIRSYEDRDLALQALDDMMRTDGWSTGDEGLAVEEIKAAIEQVDLGLLSNLFKSMTSRRSRAVADAPNREDDFEDYIKNKVYYGVRRRLDRGEMELELGGDRLRALCLAGGVMAQVARVNPEITDAEFTTIVVALQTHWHLTLDQATLVAEVAVSETASLLDPHRLVRQFADAVGPRERAEFLNVLFSVAAADGEASYDEIEEIRSIAKSLKLTHQEFIDAKLRIPSDRRKQ